MSFHLFSSETKQNYSKKVMLNVKKKKNLTTIITNNNKNS